nr:uncharacterized protein LOC128701427 [Cherax quadricarinatus]
MEYELDAKTESDDSRVSAPGISHNTIISRRANNYTFRTITDHLNGNLTLRYQRKCFNKVMFGKSNTIVCSTSADLTQSLKSFKCAVVGSKSEKGGTADMKEFFLEMDKEASTKHESCISYFEECKMQTTAVESEQNFSQKVAKCNKKCEILSPKKSSSKPKVLYSQKMSKLPSDFNSEDQFSHFFVGLDDIEDARLSDFKIPPNKNKNQPEDTNKNIERNQTFSSSSGVNGVTSAASPIQVAESCMARYKGSRIKFPGVKAGPAPKCVKLKRIMYLQSGFTSKHIFMPPTHKLHNSPCSLHGDKTSFYWKWNLGMKQCVIWPQLGGCVFKRNVLKRKLDKTKQWKTNLREMLPIIKGILSTKMVQCKKSDQDIQFDRNPAISKRKIYDFRLPNENGKMCVSNKEIIVDNDKIGKVNHINHYTRSASSTNKNKYHLERQLIGRSSRKPIDCRTAKWSRNIRKEKHKQIETVKRNTVKEMSVSARKRTSNVITRKRTVNGGNLQCKFQNKHARFGNEVVYSGKTGTSLKHIIGIPEGKERSVNKKFLHEAVQARRQKLLKDCYNTLIESSSQSQRHIAELLEQEIESNECDSHLRTHFDELGAEGTRSISSHEKGIEELGITLTTHNSPSFSVASNSTVKKFSVSSILSGTMMNESSTVINESYKKVDQAIIDYCPHRSTSSYKIRHGWKRKLHSLVACDASETKKTKVCQDSVSGLLEEQVGCEAFLQPTLKTGSVNCSEASLNKEKSTHSKRYRNGHKKQSDIPTDNKGTEECTFASNFGHDTVNRICTEKSVDEVTVQNSDPQVCDISQTINQMTGKVHKTTENTDLKGHLVKMDLGTCTTSSGSDFTMDILKNKHFKITDLLSVKNVNVLQSAEKEDEVTSHESDAVFPGGGGSDGFPSTSCGESVLIPPMKMPESNTENFDESEVETMVSKSLSDSDNGDVLSIYASSLDGMDSDVEFECQHNSEYQKLQTTESDISQESTVEMWNDNVYNTSKDKFCVDDLTINECDTSAISGSSKNRWHLTTSHNCNKKFRANCRLEDEAPNTRDQISSSDKIIGIPEPVKQDFLTSVGQCSEECNLPENNNQPVAENYSRNSLSPVTSQTSNKPKKIITLKKKLEDSSFFSERVHNTFKFRRVGRKGKTCNSKNYRKNILGYSPTTRGLTSAGPFHIMLDNIISRFTYKQE